MGGPPSNETETRLPSRGARRAWPASPKLPPQVFRLRIRVRATEGTASAPNRGAGSRSRSVSKHLRNSAPRSISSEESRRMVLTVSRRFRSQRPAAWECGRFIAEVRSSHRACICASLSYLAMDPSAHQSPLAQCRRKGRVSSGRLLGFANLGGAAQVTSIATEFRFPPVRIPVRA